MNRALTFAAQRATYGAELYDAASGIAKAVGTTEGGLLAADAELFNITVDATAAAQGGACTGDLIPLLTLQW